MTLNPSLVPAPARSYENLEGGTGRAVYYRAERFRPRALWRHLEPEVEVGEHRVRLHDLSATGLSFWLGPSQAPPEVRSRAPVRIRLGSADAFSGRAEIVRQQSVGGALKIGLRFLDDHLILRRLRHLHDRTFFEDSAERGLDVYRAVPSDYRAACNDALLFVRHWKSLLDERERQLRREAGDDLERRIAEAEALAEDRMRAEWRAIRRMGNETSREIVEGEVLSASKRLTETCLVPVLRESPFMWRSYAKPQGYPGDFLAMSWMYEGVRRGKTVFARLLDQLGLEERLAHTVPDRKSFLVDQIEACVRRAGQRREWPVQITSLGAGPAQEVVDYLATASVGPAIDFTLIDQDEQALAFAHERVSTAALAHGDRVRVRCRHVSFRQLFAKPALVAEGRRADLIYAAGVFDYLRDEVGRSLLGDCFHLLDEQGLLVVGNAARAPDVRWVPEFVFDWTMIYRSEDDLRALARDVSGRAEVSVERDPSGCWLFLLARARRANGRTASSKTKGI